MSTTPPRLEDAIRLHLAPVLRRECFTGSGRTFRRVIDGAVHLVNVQGFYYGGRFAVNLSVHPLGLPCVGGGPADAKKITHEKCEFRQRLTEGPAGRDWDHDGTPESMAIAVSDTALVFEKFGLEFFQQFTGSSSVLRTFTSSALLAGDTSLSRYCFGSSNRLAYIFARLRFQDGQHEESAAFARWALANGGATPFVGDEELRKLASGA